MNNTKEHVAALVVPAGQSTGSVDFNPMNGHVVGCVIFYKDGANTSMVRASIKDYGGKELSKLQAIDNYRSRDTSYLDGCKPLNLIVDRQTLTLEVIAGANFTTDLVLDLILIYAPENDCAA